MTGYIDLHCHYVPGVDDGVRTDDEGLALLRELRAAGFERAIATPHIRTAMFENSPGPLRQRFAAFQASVESREGLPRTDMAAEHFFDDVFWNRFERGDVCPYPGGRAILVEFSRRRLPMLVDRLFAKMCESGVRPVVAHPERYQPVWQDPNCLIPLLQAGAVLLLDTMSIIGEYGKPAALAAQRILELGWYSAACSDSHRPSHIETFKKALRVLTETQGQPVTMQLLSEGPATILDGAVPSFTVLPGGAA